MTRSLKELAQANRQVLIQQKSQAATVTEA